MENASKALIIAGAILLSIAIIGIGMYVFNMASGTINQANMSGQEIDAYNSEFIKYEGSVDGSIAKTLCNVIITHNIANTDNAAKQIILKNSVATDGSDTTKGTTTQDINIIKNALTPGRRYTVTFGRSATGLIKTIGIK